MSGAAAKTWRSIARPHPTQARSLEALAEGLPGETYGVLRFARSVPDAPRVMKGERGAQPG